MSVKDDLTAGVLGAFVGAGDGLVSAINTTAAFSLVQTALGANDRYLQETIAPIAAGSVIAGVLNGAVQSALSLDTADRTYAALDVDAMFDKIKRNAVFVAFAANVLAMNPFKSDDAAAVMKTNGATIAHAASPVRQPAADSTLVLATLGVGKHSG